MAKGLSHRLLGLQVWFDECLHGRAEFTVEGAKNFSKELGLAIAEAEGLEDGAVLAARVEQCLREVYGSLPAATTPLSVVPDEAPSDANVIPLGRFKTSVPLWSRDHGGAA